MLWHYGIDQGMGICPEKTIAILKMKWDRDQSEMTEKVRNKTGCIKDEEDAMLEINGRE